MMCETHSHTLLPPDEFQGKGVLYNRQNEVTYLQGSHTDLVTLYAANPIHPMTTFKYTVSDGEPKAADKSAWYSPRFIGMSKSPSQEPADHDLIKTGWKLRTSE
jgi:hypothetical protein